MSRTQGASPGNSAGSSNSGENRIDAAVCARAGSTIERHFAAAQLPRLLEAGASDGSFIDAKFRFSHFEGHVVIDGELNGVAVLTCQRCMQPLRVELHDPFQVMLVQDEQQLETELGGYEPVLGNPARFDLLTLAEDQALLALPLVPKHESETCIDGVIAPTTDAEPPQERTQRPFGNLRELMRGREEK